MPTEALTSGRVLHVAESEPLRGWRMWGVAETPDGPRLVAPFISPGESGRLSPHDLKRTEVRGR